MQCLCQEAELTDYARKPLIAGRRSSVFCALCTKIVRDRYADRGACTTTERRGAGRSQGRGYWVSDRAARSIMGTTAARLALSDGARPWRRTMYRGSL